MTLNELLNSDLTTLKQAARRGFDWWVEELAALIPLSMRRWGHSKRQALLSPDGTWRDPATGAKLETGPSTGTTIAVRDDEVLLRELLTPPMSGGEINRVLTMNAERYFPMPAGSILLTGAARRERTAEGLMVTDAAAIPVALAERIARALVVAEVMPAAVRVATAEGYIDPRFDFLPLMQRAGLLGARRSGNSVLWIVVAALALLNVAMFAWRDAADVDRLQALVDAQRPAVSVAQRMTSRMRSMDAIAQRAALRRGRHEPMAILAATTTAIPDGAWVQRYTWDGGTLRLTGYRFRDTDVAAALRRVPGFINVKSAQTDSIAETATGQPFDLVAEIGGR